MKISHFWKKLRKNLVDAKKFESSVFLALLLVSASFLGLLLAASGKMIAYEADSVVPVASSVRAKTAFERHMEEVIGEHPMEDMIPYIARQDEKTAAFLVGIAKQESNWGKFSPKKDGQECYNYWGYRGQTKSVTKSGYSCFESPKEAVAVVGKRLDYLVWDLRLDTPEELLVWKCGSTCAGHNPADVAKWQRTVDTYSNKVVADSSQ